MKNAILKFVTIFSCILFSAFCSDAMDEKVPILEPKKCDSPPLIDGNLDDKCWQNASLINQWYRISVDNALTKNDRQRAYVCADNQWLYIGFKIKHPAPATIVPVATEHDGRVQIENCVKILFDPGTDFNPWYIFRLSAGNVRSDQRNLRVNAEYQKSWDIPWRSATSKNNSGWNAEIAIPLYSLYETGKIDNAKTRFDLIINSIEPIDNNPANMKKVLYSWAPVSFRYWDRPQRFGYLKGLDKNKIKAPFLPRLNKARVAGGYKRSPNGQLFYTVDATVDALTGRSGSVILQVKDMPDGEKETTNSEKLNLSGGEKERVEIKVPVRNFRKRDIQVSLISPSNGESWQKIDIKNPVPLKILSAYSQLSFYTSEQNALIVCDISLDNETLSKTFLKAMSSDGVLLSRVKGPSKNFHLEVPIDKLRVGKNPIFLRLETSDGTLLGAASVETRKLPPKPGREVKINHSTCSLVRDDKAFLPFGIWGVPRLAEYFKAMKSANMNTIFTIKSIDKDYFKDAVENNISMIVLPYRFTRKVKLNISDLVRNNMKETLSILVKGIPTLTYDPVNSTLEASPFDPLHFRLPVLRQKLGKSVASDLYNKFMIAQMDSYAAVVKACKNSPATLCYMALDEPPIPLLDEDVAGMAMYREFQKIDPYHPMMVNYCGPPPEAPQATSFADIICSDTYGEGVQVHFKVAYGLVQRCRRERKVPWIILKAERVALRRLLPDEQNAQLYACAIAGIRGFFYFNFPILSRRMWNNLSQLAGEIKQMKPFFITPPLEHHISFSPGNVSLDGALPDVLAGLFKSDDGRYLLLLTNSKEYPVDITMKLPFAIRNCQLKSLRDKKTIRLSNKELREKLERYGVRAYVFEKEAVEKKLEANSFDLEMVMNSHPDLVPPPHKPLDRFSGGKKNLMVNTSMERTDFFPGWPDYYYPFHLGRAQLEEKFHLDTNNPFHGKQSLRMKAEKGETFGFYIIQGADGGLKSDPYRGDPNIEYTLSVYMRGDGKGAKLSMKSEKQKGRTMGMMTKGHVKDVVVPPEKWTRYSWQITMPALLWFNISGPGTIWLDAFQLEKNDKPTEYEHQ